MAWTAFRRRLCRLLTVAAFVATGLLPAWSVAGPAPAADIPGLAVAWTDAREGVGQVRAMRTTAPIDWVTSTIATGRAPLLRARRRRLYALSSTDASLDEISVRQWTLRRRYDLAASGTPMDVAALGHGRALLSFAGRSRLVLLDLKTATLSDSVDLAALFPPGTSIEASGMLRHRRRLFVQVRPLPEEGAVARAGMPGPTIAVIDLDTLALVDTDAMADGVQGIALAGTFAKMRMQVLPRRKLLFVSATGVFFDLGGIEVVDLATLTSQGLAIAEVDSQTGAELGAFVMLGPRNGWLAFSTDLLLSSHLHRFRAFRGVDIVEHQTSLNYFMPAIAHVRPAHAIFTPEGGTGMPQGVRAFEARSGEPLLDEVLATTGTPSDLQVVRGLAP